MELTDPIAGFKGAASNGKRGEEREKGEGGKRRRGERRKWEGREGRVWGLLLRDGKRKGIGQGGEGERGKGKGRRGPYLEVFHKY